MPEQGKMRHEGYIAYLSQHIGIADNFVGILYRVGFSIWPSHINIFDFHLVSSLFMSDRKAFLLNI